MAKAKKTADQKTVRTVQSVLAAVKKKYPEGTFTTYSDRVVVKYSGASRGEGLPPVQETKVIMV